jgi:hypothetical protein
MDVIAGLQSFKDSYEAFSSALDNEGNVLNIPSIDDCHLKQWLHQIHECMAILEPWSRDSDKNRELVRLIQTS